MFLTLLLVTLAIAVLASFLVTRLFNRSVAAILARVVGEPLSDAWHKYLTFAIYVVGVSGGVRIWSLERYITPQMGEERIVLNEDRWILEVYRTLIETLQSIAWMLLVFFIFALIAYVIMRAFELRRNANRSD